MTEVRRFLFQGLPVRGSLARLTTPWQEILKRRAANSETGPYPENVRRLLGEMTAAGVLMQSSIQFEGSLVLQIHGDGPLRLAVAEVNSDLSLRATASLAPDGAGAAQAATDMQALLNIGGQGRCAITLDTNEKRPGYRPYQGIVSLQDDNGATLKSLSAILEQYMRQSEQLDTVLVLAADEHTAAGLMVQRLPVKGQRNLAGKADADDTQDAQGQNEDFNRIATLAASLQAHELLQLDCDTLLRRLFWQEPLAELEGKQPEPHFSCQCSRARVSAMLRSLGEAEVTEMLESDKPLEIGCEFCGSQYLFDAIDVAQLFHPLSPPQQDSVH